MLLNTERHRALTPPPALLTLAAAALFAVAVAPQVFAQKAAPTTTAAASKPPVAAAAEDDKNQPPYHEYKGVRIGMPADDARRRLGAPADKGDQQDFYSFADGKEMVYVHYDAEKKVSVVSVIYMGAAAVPTAKTVFGEEVEAKPDGTVYRKTDYAKAGFWVAYSRTPGDSPMVSVTMQKRQ